MEESVITIVDEDAEKKVPEEESAINDQSKIIYKGDESGMLVEQEVNWTLLLQHSISNFYPIFSYFYVSYILIQF